jgi:hypothetical protein
LQKFQYLRVGGMANASQKRWVAVRRRVPAVTVLLFQPLKDFSMFSGRIRAVIRIALVMFGGVVLSGCDTKKEIVDIETPAGQVEVNEDTSTGEVEVDVTDNE